LQNSSTSGKLEREIFLAADAIDDPGEREAFLLEGCGDDTAMLSRLRELLELGDDDDALLSLDPDDFTSLETVRGRIERDLVEEDNFLNQLGEGIRHLGDYHLEEEIGRGAMGVVFKARQTSLNRTVALKIVLHAGLASGSDRARLRLEAEAAANLEHAHIVPIYEIGEYHGHDYYSMRLVPGGTLGDRIVEIGNDPRAAVALMVKVADAVQVAHDRGILHRDLKPDNILLDEEDEPMVSDFGLACHIDQSSKLTLTGQIMGTPKYMAPEQAEGGELPVTVASDVYGLGAILYELLAGQPVFKSNSTLKVLQMVRDQPPEPLRLSKPEIDRDLETIVLKCLEKEPARRYASVQALNDDLGAWLEYRPIAARPPTRLERVGKWIRRRPAYAALVGMGLLFLVALGVGGPIVAYHQSVLRNHADEARADANRQRKLAEERAETNRSQLYLSNMNQAGEAKAYAGFYTGLTNLLDRWRPAKNGAERDLRGWEWFYLASFLDQSGHTIPGTVEVSDLQLDPTGKRVAVARRYAKEIEIRDAVSGRLLHRMLGHRWAPWRVSWNSDGTRLASASLEGDVALWDTIEETLLEKVKAHEKEGRTVAWSPDDRTLASAGLDGKVRFWDAESLEERTDLAVVLPFPVGELAWNPRGEHLVARGHRAPKTPELYLLLTESPGISPIPVQAHDGLVSSFAWSPDGKFLATGGDQSVALWALEYDSLQLVKRLHGHTGEISSLAWGPQGQRIVSGSSNRELKIWNVPAGEQIDDLPGQPAPVTSIDWGVDTGILVGGNDGGITVWDPERVRVDQTLLQVEDPVRTLDFSPDGLEIACGMDGRPVTVIDLKTGATRSIGRPFSPGNQRVVWTPHGAGLSYRFQSARLDTVDTVTGKRRNSFHNEHGAKIVSHAWTPDGRRLALCSAQGQVRTVKILDAEDQSVERVLHEEKGPALNSVSFSPDGKFLLAVGAKLRVHLWEAATGQLVFERRDRNSKAGYSDVAWSPDGQRFALACSDNTIHVWDAEKQEITATLAGHSSAVSTVAWHPGGHRLASGGADHTIRIWDSGSGEITLTLRGHEAPVSGVHWSPDGRSLASSSLDGTLRLWDASRAYLKEKK